MCKYSLVSKTNITHSRRVCALLLPTHLRGRTFSCPLHRDARLLCGPIAAGGGREEVGGRRWGWRRGEAAFVRVHVPSFVCTESVCHLPAPCLFPLPARHAMRKNATAKVLIIAPLLLLLSNPAVTRQAVKSFNGSPRTLSLRFLSTTKTVNQRGRMEG